MDPIPLQAPGPRNVSCFVEAGFQLHDHRHVLAGRRGPAQRTPERRAGAGTVQREFDRLHLRIVSGLDDEPLEARAEGVVGVMHQDIVLVELIGH